MVIQKCTGIQEPSELIVTSIHEGLSQGKSVLFMVSGGSAIAVAVGVAQELVTSSDLSRLRIMLTDERFGPVGHKDSNWKQLHDAGFSLPRAKLLPVLRDLPFPETVRVYEEELDRAMDESDLRIGLFGMGADGHTAGILPESVATSSTSLAVGYEAPRFTRITMTHLAIARLNIAVLYAIGEEKVPALRMLEEKHDIHTQPAQALKNAGELTIFTDAV